MKPEAEVNDPETFEDNEDLTTTIGDVRGTVFVIPLDVPLPLELEDIPVPTGPLLLRLLPLATSKPEGEIAIVPLSGTELLALTRVWSLIREAKKVAVLAELPGSRDDLIFSQARRQIGLPLIEWPALAEAFAARKVERQRLGDTKPWASKEDLAPAPSLRKASGSNLKQAAETLPIPEDEVDEDTN